MLLQDAPSRLLEIHGGGQDEVAQGRRRQLGDRHPELFRGAGKASLGFIWQLD
jgi:hypothetical protein